MQTEQMISRGVDVERIRAQFPALSLRVKDRAAAYLDAPGGTQVPRTVVDAISEYLARSNANVHGPFVTSERSDQILDTAHAAVADLLGCEPQEIVFGQNMTSLTFALSRAIGRELGEGDEILTTLLDHDANVAPWRALEEERGARVLTVDIREEDCTLDLNDFERKLSARTKLVAVGYASNAVGTINPVGRIVEMAHAVGALVFVDAVHYAPHQPIDVRGLNCDFLACSAYKFFGPHVGILYGKEEHLARLRAYKVRPASDSLPDKWQTGTQNHEGIAGVLACVEYLAGLGVCEDAKAQSRRERLLAAYRWIVGYEAQLGRELISGLTGIPGIKLYGIKEPQRAAERTPTVSVRIAGRSPAQLARSLGDEGIFTWNGNFYALNLAERLGVEDSGGFLRIGLAHYNTSEEVARLIEHLSK